MPADSILLKAALDELIELCNGPNPVPPAVTSSHLLTDLFRLALGYFDWEAAAHQPDGDGGWIDILLDIDATTQIVIEVRKFGQITPYALRKAARHVRNIKAEFGILTDGLTWIYFTIKPFAHQHHIHRLLHFDTLANRALTNKVLQRSRKSTIKRLFRALDAVHADMTEAELFRLLDHGLDVRVDELANKANAKSVALSADDRAILRDLYSFTRGTPPNTAILQLLPPVALKK
jgi:hypothetical protein